MSWARTAATITVIATVVASWPRFGPGFTPTGMTADGIEIPTR